MSDHAEVIIKITREAWSVICDEHIRGELLDAVENGNADELLYSYGIVPVKEKGGVITYGVSQDD